MDAIEAMHGRRSIRSYRPTPVERSVIEEILWDAAQAPSPPVSGAGPWALGYPGEVPSANPRPRPSVHWC
jgi:nitroreductase family protein